MSVGLRAVILVSCCGVLFGCGFGSQGSGLGSIGSGGGTAAGAGNRSSVERQREVLEESRVADRADSESELVRAQEGGIFDILGRGDPDRQINVNKHLWAASLDILSFLPLETVDPFSGVISTDWGSVNGTSTPYRATVFVTGPALDARSLRVAMFRRSGSRSIAVNDEVAEQIEDSILTRARQLRIAEDR